MHDEQDRQQRFMLLLDPIRRNLERFCVHMTRDPDEAQDLYQDTLVAAWQYFDSVREHQAFKSWIYTIAANTYKRKFTRKRMMGLLSEDMVEQVESMAIRPDAATDVELVRHALRKLPPAYRQALVLFEINGLSVAEIQGIQGGTVSAIKVRLMRGRQMLAKQLGVTADASPSPATSTPIL